MMQPRRAWRSIEDMPKRHTGTRAQALRMARDAKAAHDARLAEREAQLTQALTDYYAADTAATSLREAARAEADAILAKAHSSAEQVIAQADVQIATYDTQRQAAITTIRQLGEHPASIAALCGLSTPDVRALLRARPVSDTGDPQHGVESGKRRVG
jgi:hypothetical protein